MNNDIEVARKFKKIQFDIITGVKTVKSTIEFEAYKRNYVYLGRLIDWMNDESIKFDRICVDPNYESDQIKSITIIIEVE